jgi:hypothetical protein
MMIVNQKVNTPLGVQGIVQGGYRVTDGNGQTILEGVMVRVAVNDVTREQMSQSNCITPRAMVSGLWVFPQDTLRYQESELK